ncbi:MAG TPA: HEAT repeat domain-containing protein, partial [Myxococcota bacterium]|nr:HEAT repeat domain-containing protein [Myxococcota bacterium]
MTDLLAVVALLTSPFWLLMLLNANRGRSRTQALSGVMVDLARHFGMVPNREGSDVSFVGEIEDVPIEFSATNLETSPKLRIRVPLPTSLKVVSFRPREGSKGIGRFETGDKNFDAAVATDGEVPWLGNLLDSEIRAGLGTLILSLSGRVENGQLSAEIPITLQELPEEVELPEVPTPATPEPSPAEPGGVTVQVGPPPKPPIPAGTLGYLVNCTEKVLSLSKLLIAQSAIRVDRLTTVGREESAQGVRLAALKGLMLLQRPEKVAGFVQDSDPVVRLFACSQVGDFGVPHAEAMLDDIPGPTLPADARFPPDRTAEALKAWRPLKDSSLMHGLLYRFCRAAEPAIRHAAIGAAVRLQLPHLLSFLRSLPDLPEDRPLLVQAVLHHGDPAGENLIWKWIAAGDEGMRQKAIEALVALGSPRSVQMLQAMAQGQLPEEKADGTFLFSDPKPNKEGRMDRIPVSPALSRAGRDAAVALQQR